MTRTNQTQVRQMTFQVDATNQKKVDSDYYVEGYATTFEPYELFKTDDGKPVYERVSPKAFIGAKMNDVIFQYDHEGRVYARMSNGTLGLEVDDKGLFVWADLSKTEGSRALYEDIRCGLVTKMSWKFRIAPNGDEFDANTRTFVINNVSDVYDVSAVSIPANDQTSISARKTLMEKEKAKSDAIIERERKKKLLDLKLKLGGM